MTNLRKGQKVVTVGTPAMGGFPEVPGEMVEVVRAEKSLGEGWYVVLVNHPVLGPGRLCMHASSFVAA